MTLSSLTYRTVILIPVYNDRHSVRRIVKQIIDLNPAWPIVVLDDGSNDGLVAADVAPAHLIRQTPNQGKGQALCTGFNWAHEQGYDFVLTMDADGQHPVEQIPAFMNAIVTANDFIIGRRHWNRQNMPWSRILSNTITSWLLSLRTGLDIHDSQIGFRCYPLSDPEIWHIDEGGFQFESAIFLKAKALGLNLRWVDVPVIYADEASHMHPFRDTWKFIRFFFRSFWT